MKSPIIFKLTVSSALLVLISAAVVGWLFYNKSTSLLVTHALDDIASEVQQAGDMLQQIIKNQDEDVLFLATSLPIQEMLTIKPELKQAKQTSLRYKQLTTRLISIFRSQLRRKPNYLSIRFIDKTGQELIHIKRQGNEIITSSETQLQNKSHRLYVSETLKLQPGTVYISEINLNREFGMVTQPHQEALRSATPIYNEKTGSLEGVLAITSEIGDELRVIQKRIRGKSNNEIYITNDHGGYLLHPDTSKMYGFDQGKRYRVQEDIPPVSPLFLPDNKKASMILLPKQTDGLQVVNFTKISFDSHHDERFIAVIIAQDYASIVSDQSKLLNDVLLWAFVLALGGTGLGILLSIRLTKPIAQITQVMEDYAHGRKSVVSMPTQQNDEIGRLAQSYENMINQVKEAEHNLIDVNSNLENMVAARTQELEFSENKQRSIVENMADGLITIDADGIITSFNPAAGTIFSYQAEEVIGKNSKMLIAESFYSEYNAYIKNYHKNASEKIITGDSKLEGQRKDKTCFPIELAVSE
ncbi:MAG: PAS domain S-box protein, partial [Gammaproteobacteria bacterium]|nr:PAS domain S-box protein [Gammaproteobacteria bacterium]